MRNPLRWCAAVLLALCFSASHLYAWGGEGHQVIALIAEMRLTEIAQQEIHELLDGADISDAEIASWADEIKRQRRRTAPWHYVNISTSQPAYDAKRDGNNGNNVIDRTIAFERLLSDRSKPKEARVEALKFLVHLLGDLHQPLHCANRDDRGGNDCKVRLPGSKATKKNLHGVWDTDLLRRFVGKTAIYDYAATLNEKIDQGLAREWKAGTPVDWANEAHQAAVDSAYKGVPVQDEIVELDEQYVEASRVVIERQVQRGGIRLAEVLNRCFR